ncbi:hypothetical protein C7M84_015626 [Penaeus vannamei]|uniref:Uncharacterized protein n=1 Tax=Penaeus vannamei TaxID=6689 RepID=A0A3R7SLZ5_PENVA|nr:hypothetical protein C7M84_015626 [Penaeus vannamei]
MRPGSYTLRVCRPVISPALSRNRLVQRPLRGRVLLSSKVAIYMRQTPSPTETAATVSTQNPQEIALSSASHTETCTKLFLCNATLAPQEVPSSTRPSSCQLYNVTSRSRRHFRYAVIDAFEPRRSFLGRGLRNVLFPRLEVPACPRGSNVILGVIWACLGCGFRAISLPCSWFKIVSDQCILASYRDAACHPAHTRLEAWIVNHGPWVP